VNERLDKMSAWSIVVPLEQYVHIVHKQEQTIKCEISRLTMQINNRLVIVIFRKKCTKTEVDTVMRPLFPVTGFILNKKFSKADRPAQ